MKMKRVEFFLFTAAEMLDPKAKESSSSKSPFPWSRRETSTSSSNGGSPRVVTKPPPVPSHSVHTVQSYAKSQEEQNATCLSKTEHRYSMLIPLGQSVLCDIVMAHLHCRRQIQILIPNPIPFLYWLARIGIRIRLWAMWNFDIIQL